MARKQLARPLDKAFVDELNAKRRERLRLLRNDGRHDEYTVLEQDQADNPSSIEDGDKLHRLSTAHMLFRMLSTTYIVPLSDASTVYKAHDADATCDKSTESFGLFDMLNFTKSLLGERPTSLEHTFKTSRGTTDSFESTTFDVWLLPRLVCASAVSLCRKDEQESCDALLDFAFTVLDVQLRQCKDLSNVSNVRLTLQELLSGSIRALAATGRPTFMSSSPPPLHLAPHQPMPSSAPSVIFFEKTDDPKRSLKAFNAQKSYGNGINGIWMRDDHSTFTPAGWEGASSSLKIELAQALFAICCTITMRSASKFPALLSDLGILASTLLLSNWECDRSAEQSPLRLDANGSKSTSSLIESQRIQATRFIGLAPLLHDRLLALCGSTHSDELETHRSKRLDDSGNISVIRTITPATNSQDLRTIARVGLSSIVRAQRLCAARRISSLVELICEADDMPQQEISNRIRTLFDSLQDLLRHGKAKICESVIHCLTLMGQIRSESGLSFEMRGRVVRTLVLELGDSNVYLGSLAYGSLVQLAMHHGRTPFQLLAPYLDSIAPDVVERMSTTPNLFFEVLHLTKQNQSKFLQVTLQYTLPRIIDRDDTKTLDLIAKGIGGGLDVQSMCFNHAPAILLNIMLQVAPRRDRSMRIFMDKVRGSHQPLLDHDAVEAQSNITVKSMLKGYSVELIGNLVMNLGDLQESKRKRAFEALQFMDSTLNERHASSRTAASRDVFLQEYLLKEILAILSWLNEELMNAHGKKSIAHKAMVVRSIGALIDLIGVRISLVTPQLMATLNTTMQVPDLVLATLQSLSRFVKLLDGPQVGPFLGQITATLLSRWQDFGKLEREDATSILTEIVVDNYEKYSTYIERDLPDLSAIRKDIPEVWNKLSIVASRKRPEQRLAHILDRVGTENMDVCLQALLELRTFLHSEQEFLERATSGNAFDTIIGLMIRRLFQSASRVHDEDIRDLSLENLAIIGAIDPDRLPQASTEHSRNVLQNFTKEELTDFAVYLIRDLLIGTYKATHDTKHQSALAYAIQELLKFCGFTPAVLSTSSSTAVQGGLALRNGSGGLAGGGSVNLKTRQRWNTLSKVADTLAPLLQSKYVVQHAEPLSRARPFYSHTSSFKEWLQSWTNALIVDIDEEENASILFGVLRTVIRDHDLTVAQFVLPHLVLYAITLGTEEQGEQVGAEIVAVLKDQVASESSAGEDERRKLSSQTIFGVLDHLSVWQRYRQRDKHRLAGPAGDKRGGGASSNKRDAIDVAVSRMERVMNSISQELMAKASLRCRAYARSLMNYEQCIRTMGAGEQQGRLQELYENIHLIYANLDEPDGMEGISCYVLQPSLDHQIREHESTGRWTSAQSCWEVKIQAEPNNLDSHVGLLRCLRNLGHYDTMRTHILGVLSSNKAWQDALSPFYVEGCCILSDWEAVRHSLEENVTTSPQHAMARVMLAMYDRKRTHLLHAIKDARLLLGKPLIASNYVSAYDAVTQLHMLHELGMISKASGMSLARSVADEDENIKDVVYTSSKEDLRELNRALSVRLESTLPSFRTREPLLSMRRSALNTQSSIQSMRDVAGQCWIASSKIARREGHLQTAYSAALQASQAKVPLAFVQHAKLRVAAGDQGQATLLEIRNALSAIKVPPSTEPARLHSFANAHLFYARLSDASGRLLPNEIIDLYKRCTTIDPDSEKMWYHLGHYYDQFQERSAESLQTNLGNRMMHYYYTCKNFSKSALYGTKYFYRTVPRLLTIWLTAGDNDELLATIAKSKRSNAVQTRKSDDLQVAAFNKISETIRKAIDKFAPYQWLAVFPQLVSRVAHRNDVVWKLLQEIISHILTIYPHQAMWIMLAGLQSTDEHRRERFAEIVQRVKSATKAPSKSGVARTIDAMIKMAKELLYLCDSPVKKEETQLSMKAHFPRLLELVKKEDLILPIQSSLSVTMPSTGTADAAFNVFPDNLPRMKSLENTIEVMHSLQRPRKIQIEGTDGITRAFLCKPNDDLRKDARLMEFDGMINNLLQSNSESRKRRLYIRTYAVVTLNEECGLIEWVPNTTGLRHILQRLYASRGIPLYSSQIKADHEAANKDPKATAQIFEERILKKFPPVFHEWFVTTFPEPSAWLAARLNYGRTLAVMSMVGWVLGLGDRHGENILFDSVSGDTLHVDLNCLFEKGATFEVPERVPFRLTQNLVDALGVTGVEGVFRKAAEISMSILRDHKDSLMSVLEAMVHDPLVEWGVDNRTQAAKQRNSSTRTDPRVVQARKSLDPVRRRLLGQLRRPLGFGNNTDYGDSPLSSDWTSPYSTNSLVDALIRDATNLTLLAQMYIGWSAYL